MTNCYRHGTGTPPCLRELMTELALHQSDPGPEDPVWRIHEAIASVIDLRSDVLHAWIADPGEMIAEALQLDLQLASALSTASLAWSYDVVPAPVHHKDIHT